MSQLRICIGYEYLEIKYKSSNMRNIT